MRSFNSPGLAISGGDNSSSFKNEVENNLSCQVTADIRGSSNEFRYGKPSNSMWWLPPIQMSSLQTTPTADLSGANSSRKSKTKRSVESLKKAVISDCLAINNLGLTSNQPREVGGNILPAEMWWVPPFKSPSTCTMPAMTMLSSPSTAKTSSSRPKVIRSAEDLRRIVSSQCSLIEAAGISGNEKSIKSPLNKEKSSLKCERSRRDDSVVPPLFISTERTQSSATKSHKSVRDIEISMRKATDNEKGVVNSPYSSDITPKVRPCESFSDERFEPIDVDQSRSFECFDRNIKISMRKATDGNEKRVKGIFNTPSSVLSSNNVTLKVGPCESYSDNHFEPISVEPSRTCSELSCQRNQLNSGVSIGDLACKHIVNPMMSKLARLCTQQGQQYLAVLEDLQEACDNFHKACIVKDVKN